MLVDTADTGDTDDRGKEEDSCATGRMQVLAETDWPLLLLLLLDVLSGVSPGAPDAPRMLELSVVQVLLQALMVLDGNRLDRLCSMGLQVAVEHVAGDSTGCVGCGGCVDCISCIS